MLQLSGIHDILSLPCKIYFFRVPYSDLLISALERQVIWAKVNQKPWQRAASALLCSSEDSGGIGPAPLRFQGSRFGIHRSGQVALNLRSSGSRPINIRVMARLSKSQTHSCRVMTKSDRGASALGRKPKACIRKHSVGARCS